MSAGVRDISIDRYATFRRVMTLKNEDDTAINLTGYGAAMQVRERPEDTEPLADWSDKLTLGGSAGTITLVISDEETSTLDFDQARFDIVLEQPNGEKFRLLEGSVVVNQGITR